MLIKYFPWILAWTNNTSEHSERESERRLGEMGNFTTSHDRQGLQQVQEVFGVSNRNDLRLISRSKWAFSQPFNRIVRAIWKDSNYRRRRSTVSNDFHTSRTLSSRMFDNLIESDFSYRRLHFSPSSMCDRKISLLSLYWCTASSARFSHEATLFNFAEEIFLFYCCSSLRIVLSVLRPCLQVQMDNNTVLRHDPLSHVSVNKEEQLKSTTATKKMHCLVEGQIFTKINTP